MRGSSWFSMIARRISALAGTVTMTHATTGAGRSAISKRFHRKAKPRGWRSIGSTVHWRVSDLPDGFTTSSPSLKVWNSTMPRLSPRNDSRNAGRTSTVSARAWIGRGRHQSFGSG